MFSAIAAIATLSRKLYAAMLRVSSSLPGFAPGGAGSMRNGSAVLPVAPSRVAAIEQKWYWSAVANGSRAAAATCIGSWVAVSFGRLTAAATPAPAARARASAASSAVGFAAAAAGAVPTSGTVADWTALAGAAAADPAIRLAAIALGAARASVSFYWGLEDADLLATELDNALVVQFTPAVGLAGAATRLVNGHSDNAGDLTSTEAFALSMADLSPVEWELAFAVFRVAVAAVPLAGVCLIENGHHYLSHLDAAVRGVENQVFSGVDEAVRALYDSNKDVLRDAIWHKSVHPIGPAFLRAAACEDQVPVKLVQLGLGSAAVRLPYTEPELKASRAYLAVLSEVKVFLGESGHMVGLPRLTACVEMASRMPSTGQMQVGTALMTRAEYIRDVVVPAKDAAVEVVAWALGVVKSSAADSDIPWASMSIGRSFAIKKILRDRTTAVGAGARAYSEFVKARRTKAANGELLLVIMSDDPAVTNQVTDRATT